MVDDLLKISGGNPGALKCLMVLFCSSVILSIGREMLLDNHQAIPIENNKTQREIRTIQVCIPLKNPMKSSSGTTIPMSQSLPKLLGKGVKTEK